MRKLFERTILFAMVGALALAALPATAQETVGSLKGSVADDVGTPIAGAIIEAVGPMGTLSTTSDSEGNYRFPRLPAGDYKVTARVESFLDAVTDTNVYLGEAQSINFSMQKTFSEEITVYSDTVSIDFTESATTTSIRQWEIDYLPRGRNYTDVVQFAAGAVQNNQAGGISVDGASGLENRYVVDGIDTTDPENGTAAIPMRAEMMEEVQVKSAGYMAEYGGALGGVINAITRSGGNQFHGSVFVDMEDNSWNGSARPEVEYNLDDAGAGLVTYDKDDEVRYDPGFTIGGPILRDKWWFFASYQPGIRTRDRTVSWVDLPITDTYSSDFRVDYAMLNTTVNISSALLFKAGLNFSPYTIDGTLPDRDGRSGLWEQDNYVPLGTEGERETYYLTADWIASDNFVVSGRGGFYHTNIYDTGVPDFDIVDYYYGQAASMGEIFPEIPQSFVHNYGWRSDPLQFKTNENTYERTAYGLDATWFFQGAGDHSLKFGYQNEEIYNNVIDGYNGNRMRYYWDDEYTSTSSEVLRGEYGYFRLMKFGTFGDAKTKNQAIFIQDNWTVTPNLTLNIGLRSENEQVPNYGSTGPDPAIAFGWGDKLAPRLGFAWDVTGDSKWKVYGSWGQYYDVTKYAMPRGSFGGDTWVDYYFTFDDWNTDLNYNDPGCRVGENTILVRPTCPGGTFIEAVDRRLNSADPLTWEVLGYPTIDPDLKPMESWEAQIGADYQLTSVSQVGARYVHKEIVRTIEDVGLLYPGIGEVYIIANPGEGFTNEIQALPFQKPVREYDALELSYTKRFTNNWSLRAYYTLSKLWGNYSGLANSDEQNSVGNPLNPVGTSARRDPNVSRLYDHYATSLDENGDAVLGNLATNRTHQIGAQFLYSFNFGLNVGANQYIGSGTPVTTIGQYPFGNYFYPFGRGDLGETDWLTQTDLTLYYTFNFGNNLGLSFGLTVLNLFDEDTATRQWTQRNDQDIPVDDDDWLTGFSFEEQMASLPDTAVDTRFGLWDTYQLPRNFRFTIKFEF